MTLGYCGFCQLECEGEEFAVDRYSGENRNDGRSVISRLLLDREFRIAKACLEDPEIHETPSGRKKRLQSVLPISRIFLSIWKRGISGSRRNVRMLAATDYFTFRWLNKFLSPIKSRVASFERDFWGMISYEAYNQLMEQCMVEENLTEEDFWQSLGPYAEKSLYWEAHLSILNDDYEKAVQEDAAISYGDFGIRRFQELFEAARSEGAWFSLIFGASTNSL